MSAVGLCGLSAMAQVKFRIEQNKQEEKVTFLSWDSEGGDRTKINLLRAPATGAVLAQREDTIDILSSGELVLPFDPRATSTTVLSSRWTEDGTFHLPAIINAPDFGPLLLTQAAGGGETIGWIKGSRTAKTVDVILRDKSTAPEVRWQLKPLILRQPVGVDADLWTKARRGWLNGIQPCAQWG